MNTNPEAQKESSSKELFAFNRENYKFLLIGIAVVVLGYLLMIGGGSADPNEFHAEELFSTRRITIAPITVVFGYAIIFYAILKKSKPTT